MSLGLVHNQTKSHGLTKMPPYQKGWVYIYGFGSMAITFFIGSVIVIMSVIYDGLAWQRAKENCEERISVAKACQEKALALTAREDLKALNHRLYFPFDGNQIAQGNLETWISAFLSRSFDMPIDVTVTLDKDDSPHPYGDEFDGRLLSFRIKTYTENAFFSVLKHIAESTPFYGDVQGYTLKRLQPLTDSVLMDIKQGRKSYLFEGTVDVLAVAPAFDDADANDAHTLSSPY